MQARWLGDSQQSAAPAMLVVVVRLLKAHNDLARLTDTNDSIIEEIVESRTRDLFPNRTVRVSPTPTSTLLRRFREGGRTISLKFS